MSLTFRNNEIAKGPVRTGVIKILPKGKSKDPVPAGRFCLNGDTEMTGTIVKMWIN
jgi:hypothetical protein